MASVTTNLSLVTRASLDAGSSKATRAPTRALKNTPGMNRLSNLVCMARKEGVSSSVAQQAMEAVKDVQVPDAARKSIAAVVANILVASPAHAGVLFDFNLTLPIIMGQFLVLMFILDKVVFSPVGEQIEGRDSEIRGKVDAVGDSTEEIDALTAEAKGIIKEASLAAKAAGEAAEKKTVGECNEKLAVSRTRLDGEMATAMAKLLDQEAESKKTMVSQVEKLSDEIADKVLSTADTTAVAA